MTASRIKTPLPKEHGAWAMLLTPFAASAIAAGSLDVKLVLLLVGVLSLYLARFCCTQWVRSKTRRSYQESLQWPIIYSIVGIACGAVVVFGYGLWGLTLMGGIAALSLLVYLLLFIKRLDRSASTEVMGVATLTMTAWAGYYTATGSLGRTGLIMWLVCFLFFASSVFFVKMKVEGRPKNSLRFTLKQKLSSGRAMLTYQVLSLVAIISLTWAGTLPVATIAAFLPVSVYRGMGIAKPKQELNIKRLGFTELGHAVFFGILLGIVFRSQPG